eukprot:COSAG01_NODE_1601_length_9765_cov_8.340265_2_plen_525_part_00
MQGRFKKMESQNDQLRGGSVDIRKHRQQIMRLQKMDHQIRNELATETRLAAVNNSSTAAAKLAKLREQKERYQAKVETEKLRLEQLEAQIKEMRAQIIGKKKMIGGETRAVENHRLLQKRITILENQLDKALQRCNGQQTSNQKLRATIDNLRKERTIMDNLQKKHERELASKKDKMQGIIDEAEGAYAARQKAQDNIARLKTSAEAEENQFLMEWQQLGGMVEHDRAQKQGFAPGFVVGEGDRPEDEMDVEQFLRKKIVRTHWQIAFDKAKQEVALSKVQKYENAFSKIKEVTGIEDVETLVNRFIAAEESSYSFFNVVNDLSREIEKVERELQEIRDETTKIRQGAKQNVESTRLRALHALEQKLEHASKKTEHFEAKQAAVNSTLAEIMPGIQKVFDSLGCAAMPMAQELQREHPEGLTESNVAEFLTLIEAKAIDKLQKYAQIRSEELGWTVDELLVARPYMEMTTAAKAFEDVQSHIPTIDESEYMDGDEDEGGDGDRPLTRGEMQTLAQKSMTKRGGK